MFVVARTAELKRKAKSWNEIENGNSKCWESIPHTQSVSHSVSHPHPGTQLYINWKTRSQNQRQPTKSGTALYHSSSSKDGFNLFASTVQEVVLYRLIFQSSILKIWTPAQRRLTGIIISSTARPRFVLPHCRLDFNFGLMSSGATATTSTTAVAHVVVVAREPLIHWRILSWDSSTQQEPQRLRSSCGRSVSRYLCRVVGCPCLVLAK